MNSRLSKSVEGNSSPKLFQCKRTGSVGEKLAQWPWRPAAKIIYDPAAGEVRVSGHSRGKAFKKLFLWKKTLNGDVATVTAFVRDPFNDSYVSDPVLNLSKLPYKDAPPAP